MQLYVYWFSTGTVLRAQHLLFLDGTFSSIPYLPAPRLFRFHPIRILLQSSVVILLAPSFETYLRILKRWVLTLQSKLLIVLVHT